MNPPGERDLLDDDELEEPTDLICVDTPNLDCYLEKLHVYNLGNKTMHQIYLVIFRSYIYTFQLGTMWRTFKPIHVNEIDSLVVPKMDNFKKAKAEEEIKKSELSDENDDIETAMLNRQGVKERRATVVRKSGLESEENFANLLSAPSEDTSRARINTIK